MDDAERLRRRMKVRHAALNRLGATNVYCLCGEDDPICFEADHVYRREHDGACWAICCNCHRKRSARGWSEHPPIKRGETSREARIGHLLSGVADYLEFAAGHLRSAAGEVLDGSDVLSKGAE